MTDYRIVSLTTDYGTADGFVAACHGVILVTAPRARILDITHQVPPGDIRRGATVLAQTVGHLPPGVHVAVVDPGVGTTRRPIAVEAGESILVGPDNGLLIPAADALGGARLAMALTNSELHRHPTSHTFHGRDIFAPVAAALLTGTTPGELGDPVRVTDLVRLPDPLVRNGPDGLHSEVLTVDRFGNLQLAATTDLLTERGERLWVNEFPAVRADMFAAAGMGELVVLTDSAGHIAVAVNGGSAAEQLRLAAGDTVTLADRTEPTDTGRSSGRG